MIDYAITELQKLAEESGLPLVLKDGYYFELQTPLIYLTIEKRHPGCDRGRWSVLATTRDKSRMTIDDQDMFPRYYFGDQALVSELIAWLQARKQWPAKAVQS